MSNTFLDRVLLKTRAPLALEANLLAKTLETIHAGPLVHRHVLLRISANQVADTDANGISGSVIFDTDVSDVHEVHSSSGNITLPDAAKLFRIKFNLRFTSSFADQMLISHATSAGSQPSITRMNEYNGDGGTTNIQRVHGVTPWEPVIDPEFDAQITLILPASTTVTVQNATDTWWCLEWKE